MSKKQIRADAAARKRAERQRRESAGLVRVEVWIKPENRAKLQDFAAKLS